ncbi:MAG: hypothetical protein RBS81_02170 [Tenuifilaceae bacterium]|jgi:hypothetical protein|nr:hypothetical protein [Tenuifilaceae bacterium]
MTPDYLYHYTSIEALALILSSQKIRFNTLVALDDLTEGKCQDIKSIGQYLFVSSWTDIEQESLPFWNMYTPNMKGVRIKMPSTLFNNYYISTKGIEGLKSDLFVSIIPQNESFKESYWIIPTHKNYLFRVVYTDNHDNLYPEIHSLHGDQFTMDFNKVGHFKSKHWIFQSEWRFILKILPLSYIPETPKESDLIMNSLNSIQKEQSLPFSDYFVYINELKFKEMEILLGPRHSKSDRVIVESLICKYNPTAKLYISELHGKIK